MQIKCRIAGIHLSLLAQRQVKVLGINSKIDAIQHILMWDFDGKDVHEVRAALIEIRNAYNLPQIHMVNGGHPLSFHAYCFDRHSFREASGIIAMTRNVDKDFVAFGILRGYFTLRITPKGNRHFLDGSLTIKGLRDENVSPSELTSISEYWTKRNKKGMTIL